VLAEPVVEPPPELLEDARPPLLVPLLPAVVPALVPAPVPVVRLPVELAAALLAAAPVEVPPVVPGPAEVAADDGDPPVEESPPRVISPETEQAARLAAMGIQMGIARIRGLWHAG